LPLYAYRCTKCGYEFEKIQSFNAAPESECPRCQGVLERPLTAPALQFKGAGWYVNDYAPKSAASSSDSKTAESNAPPTGDAKPAASDASAKSPSSESTTSPPSSESAAKPSPPATST
jgi:putative FmdB family regulatory protein